MSEFLPEGEVVISEALPVIGQLAACIFILGCLYVVDGFVRALFGTLTGTIGWIPYLGHVLRAPVHRIEQKVSHSLGHAEQGFDKRIGTSWHKLGHVARLIGRELEGQAKLLWAIAGVLSKLTDYHTVLRLIRALEHPIRTLQHIHTRLLRQEAARARAAEHKIDHGVFPQLRTIEAGLAHVIDLDIPGLRARDRALADQLGRLGRWVHGRRVALTTGAFLGAFAWALHRLGGSWIRCGNWRKIGNHVCHIPHDLIEALVGLTVSALALRDLCRIVSLIEGIAIRVQPQIEALVLELEGFMCGGTAALPSGTVQSDLQRVAALPSGITAGDLRPPAAFSGF